MPVRVLVVDDSGFFRRRLTEILNADPRIEVIGTAVDGKEAIDQTIQLKPDVVTMDIEMPVMDGITAVRKIMERCPTPVLMFSSLTTQGAQATLDALEAGAMDFLPKNMDDISQDKELARRQLCARVRLIGARGLKHKPVLALSRKPGARAADLPLPPSTPPKPKGSYRLVAIGTSTGGPVALQEVLTRLPANFPLPILLVQHMPASFTPAFAQRLDKLAAISVKEAEHGDVLRPGTAYLAPGGTQMELTGSRGHVSLNIYPGVAGQTYKPSVDITFSSVASVYKGDVLAVVLTGMGADGREGARALKAQGATVWAQDEASSVIYGMPAAIAEAGLADRILALNTVAPALTEAV